MIFRIVPVTLMIFQFVHFFAAAQPSRSIYYISIGSTHYTKSKIDLSTCDNWLESLPSANKSAEYFAKAAQRLYPKKGLLITSTANNVITKQRLSNEFEKFGQFVRSDTSKEKIILIYFYIHGESNNLNEVLYLIPGNIACEEPYFYIQQMDSLALSMYSLMNMITNSFGHYSTIQPVILLDCCYGLKTPDPIFQKMVDSITLSKRLYPKWISPWLQMKRWTLDLTNWPILFSSVKGSVSEPMHYLENPHNDKIGRVCNAFVEATNNQFKSRFPSMSNLIREIQYKGISSNSFGLYPAGNQLKIKR